MKNVANVAKSNSKSQALEDLLRAMRENDSNELQIALKKLEDIKPQLSSEEYQELNREIDSSNSYEHADYKSVLSMESLLNAYLLESLSEAIKQDDIHRVLQLLGNERLHLESSDSHKEVNSYLLGKLYSALSDKNMELFSSILESRTLQVSLDIKAYEKLDEGLRGLNFPQRDFYVDKITENIISRKFYPDHYTCALLAQRTYLGDLDEKNLEFGKIGETLSADKQKDLQSILTKWELIKSVGKGSGYYGAIYANHNAKQLVIAHKIEDQQSLSKVITQHAYAQILTEELIGLTKGEQYEGYSITTTGHSLGGWLAQLSLFHAYKNLGCKSIKAVVFDSPGAGDMMKKLQGSKVDLSELNIVEYISSKSPATCSLGTHIGTVYSINENSFIDQPLEHILEAFDKHTGVPKSYSLAESLSYSDFVPEVTEIDLTLPLEWKTDKLMEAFESLKAVYLSSEHATLGDIIGLPTKGNTDGGSPETQMKERYHGKLAKYQEAAIKDSAKYPDYLINQEIVKELQEIDPQADEYRSILTKILEAQRNSYFSEIRELAKSLSELHSDNLLPAPVEHFIGRKEELAKLEEKLTLYNSATIHGPVGIGKTAMAVHLCQKDGYDLILQATKVDGINALYNKYLLLAIEAGIKIPKESNVSGEVIKNVNTILDYEIREQGRKVAFIIDDVKSYEAYQEIEGYISQLKGLGVKVIITTQDSAIGYYLEDEALSLNSFNEEEAREFLSHNVEGLSDEEIDTLLTETKGKTLYLPQALDSIAKQLELDPSLDIESYLEECEETDGIFDTPKFLLDGVDLQQANELLQYFPYLESSPIPVKLFEGIFDNDKLYGLIDSLRHKHLLVFDEQKDVLVAHNIVRDSIPKYLNNEGITMLEEEKIIGILFQSVNARFSVLEKKDFQKTKGWEEEATAIEKYIPHAHKLLTYGNEELEGKLYSKLGRYYKDIAADYNKALECHKKALELKEQSKLNNENLEISYNDIGNIYYSQGKYNEALDCLKEVLILRKEVLGEMHPKIANSYDGIGNVYRSQGKYDQALENHKKALSIREKILGENSSDVAASYGSIGTVYESQGNHEQALKYLQKALSIREEVLGDKHLDAALSYNNIGLIYKSLGNHEQALKYLQKALSIREEVLGERHLDTVTSYDNIGAMYAYQGRYDKALEYFLKTLEAQSEALGERHLDTAASYNNIGLMYKKLGNHEQALKYLQKALIIRKEELGDKHLVTTLSYNNVGATYASRGEYDKALEYYHKALNVRETALGTKSLILAPLYDNIGYVYDSQGNVKEALKYYKKALNIFEKEFVIGHHNIATSYKNAGDEHEPLGKIEYFDTCKTEAGEKVSTSSDDEDDGDHSSAGESSYKYPTTTSNSNVVGQASAPSSRDNGREQSGKTTDNETTPSKGAVLAVIEEIESHGALIHDERLKAQLKHYAKTGVVYDTLAPYVEAAEAAHPALFVESAIQREAMEEHQRIDDSAHINQELLDKVISMVEAKGGIMVDEKLVAQLRYYALTGEAPETLDAYLNLGVREIQEVYNFDEEQQANATCCAQEAGTLIETPEMPTYIEPIS